MDLLTSDYICAGYFISRYAPLPPYHSADLLPERLFSLSDCFSGFLPDAWSIEWVGDSDEKRRAKAAAFGIGDSDLPRFITWATANVHKGFAWPNVCRSLDFARGLIRDFLPIDGERVLFGAGLHRTYVDRFLEHAKPLPPQPGYAPIGAQGVYELISEGQFLAEGGTPLGFDLVTFHHTLGCCWLCNRLERVFSEDYRIRPNSDGFLSSFVEASRCAELINTGAVSAEPGLWLPWLIVKFPET